MSERFRPVIASKERREGLSFLGCLRTPGAGVSLYSDLDIPLFGPNASINTLAADIPGLKVSYEMNTLDASLLILKGVKNCFRHNRINNSVTLTGKRDDFLDGVALGWISYWMMEAQRQDKSLFTLHASALRIRGKGIILLGQSGSGKTSVMIDLCRKYRGEIVSNDLTIIGHNPSNRKLTLVDGTKGIRLRHSSIANNFPEFLSYFNNESGHSWENKITVTPEQLRLRSSTHPDSLDYIFEIRLDSNRDEPLRITRDTEAPMYYKLYEDMSRIIRGSAISIFTYEKNFWGYLPSLDTKKLHNKRVNCINQMIRGHGVTNISGGNINELTETIHNIVNAS